MTQVFSNSTFVVFLKRFSQEVLYFFLKFSHFFRKLYKNTNFTNILLLFYTFFELYPLNNYYFS